MVRPSGQAQSPPRWLRLPELVGALGAFIPAIALLMRLIIEVTVWHIPPWRRLSGRGMPMLVGACLIAVPQIVLARWDLGLLIPFAWIMAFGLGRRAALGPLAVTGAVRNRLVVGVMLGLLATLLLAVFRQLLGAPGSPWLGLHENLWAARLAVVAIAAAVIAPAARPGVFLVLIAAAGALVSGSRATLLGVLIGAVVFLWFGGWAHRLIRAEGLRRLVAWGSILAVSGVVLSPAVRAPLVDGVRGLMPRSQASNLVPASEDVGEPPWILEGVRVSMIGRDAEGFAITKITKTDARLGSRPIAPVDLEPGVGYVVSAHLAPDPGLRPGLRLWAPASGQAPALTATFALDGQGLLLSTDPGMLLEAQVVKEAEDGWRIVRVRMELQGDVGRRVWIGPAPDLRDGAVGASIRMARFQVAAETQFSGSYVPTFAESGSARTARSRLQIFSIALAGIAEAPWLGHGPGRFEAYQRMRSPDAFVFTHAHNALLQILFETGAAGLAGWALLFGAMLWPNQPGRWRPAHAALVISVVGMNVFDYTFVAADVTMVFAAALGFADGERDVLTE